MSERRERATTLALPYNEFDQAYGDGWRSYFEAGDTMKAVTLLEDYLVTHQELSFGQRKFLHLHAGQMLALEGKTTRAVKHFDLAMSHTNSAELWPDWDDYLSATKAFLMQDRPSLLAARERLAASNAPRLKLADRFIRKFGRSYAEVIWWVPVCSSVAISEEASTKERPIADRLAKALGCEVTIGETNASSCCIWLQVRPFSPKAVPKGYVIAHTADGTLISASNAEWLEDAVRRFIKSWKENDGYREAPFGMTSNFEPNRYANSRGRKGE